MNKTLSLLTVVFLTQTAFSATITGTFQSDCQDLSDNSQGYWSQRPIDTFNEDLSATLLIHVYEDKHCTGAEWDTENIPCTYWLGKDVSGLPNTTELDLSCVLEGKMQLWYEIVEAQGDTLRYGNQTGLSPEERPHELGKVYYRRVPVHSR